jgi:hypothetical protein
LCDNRAHWNPIGAEPFLRSRQLRSYSGIFQPCYWNRMSITMYTKALHLSLSWGRSIQSTQLQPTSLRSILILSSHVRLSLHNGLFLSEFRTINLYSFFFVPYVPPIMPISSSLTSSFLAKGTRIEAAHYAVYSYLVVTARSHFTSIVGPPLWSSGQSSWLQIQRSGFDSRRYNIFWEVVGLERGPLSLVSTIEELLGRKNSGSGIESREYGRRDASLWPRCTLYSQKLALISPTSGGRSVGIVRSRTQATEFTF